MRSRKALDEIAKITKTTKKFDNNKYHEILQGHARKMTRKCKLGRGRPSTKQRKLRKPQKKKKNAKITNVMNFAWPWTKSDEEEV